MFFVMAAATLFSLGCIALVWRDRLGLIAKAGLTMFYLALAAGNGVVAYIIFLSAARTPF
jgi:hypothetical protein